MNEERRRRLAGQYAAISTPPDRRRAVQQYQAMAREAEDIRQKCEARKQAAKEGITDALIRCERAYHFMVARGRPADAAEYDAAWNEFMDAVQAVVGTAQHRTQEHA